MSKPKELRTHKRNVDASNRGLGADAVRANKNATAHARNETRKIERMANAVKVSGPKSAKGYKPVENAKALRVSSND